MMYPMFRVKESKRLEVVALLESNPSALTAVKRVAASVAEDSRPFFRAGKVLSVDYSTMCSVIQDDELPELLDYLTVIEGELIGIWKEDGLQLGVSKNEAGNITGIPTYKPNLQAILDAAPDRSDENGLIPRETDPQKALDMSHSIAGQSKRTL